MHVGKFLFVVSCGLAVLSSSAAPVSVTNVPGMRKQVLCRPDAAYSFLHDNAIVEHRGRLHVAWYNCPSREMVGKSVIRGRVSADRGVTWGEVRTLVEDASGRWLYVPPAWGSDGTNLFLFVTRMTGCDLVHDCEIFQLEESAGKYRSIGLMGMPFLPNTGACRLGSGKWIVGGRRAERPGETPEIPAVVISEHGLAGPWRLVDMDGRRLPDGTPYVFPEPALRVTGEEVEAVVRGVPGKMAMVRYLSTDGGVRWRGPEPMPLQLAPVKAAAGTLPDGRRFLVANPKTEKRRDALVLYVGGRGAGEYETAVTLANGADVGLGATPEWSYPSACVQDDLLHVVYTSGKKASVICTLPWAEIR